jgi:hypothetical protein
VLHEFALSVEQVWDRRLDVAVLLGTRQDAR